MSWTVYTSWRANGVVSAEETQETRPDWRAARRQALRMCCLNGVRYVSVQGPDDVVAGEYDRITKRWREYPRGLAGEEQLPTDPRPGRGRAHGDDARDGPRSH